MTVQDIRERPSGSCSFALVISGPAPKRDIVRIIADTDQLSDGLLLKLFPAFLRLDHYCVPSLHAQPVGGNYPPGFGLDSFEFHRGPLAVPASPTRFRKQSQTRGEQTSLIEEMVSGVKVVKALVMKNRLKPLSLK